MEPEPIPLELAPAESPPAPLPPIELSLSNTLRRFFHLLALLLILFLVVRTFFVEPFGVTTGSMAATVHGNNRQAPCPRCGFPLCVGSPTQEDRLNPQVDAWCPNCGKKPIDLTAMCEEIPGDRLLVDKSAFAHRPPRRWEVAVFRCPVDDTKPYVKRVVGLPGEAIRIFDGDIYANGEIARKPWNTYSEVRIPVFTMAHVPEPETWTSRWFVEPIADDPKLPAPPRKDNPLANVEAIVQGNRLVLDGSSEALGLTYRHRNLDTKADETIRDRLAYNGGVQLGRPQPVHDFSVECEVEVLAGTGMLSLRLWDGADSVRADLPVGTMQETSLEGGLAHDGGVLPRIFTGARLHPGSRHKVEFGFIDRRAFLLIDGVEIVEPLELPPPKRLAPAKSGDPAAERKGIDRPLQLGVRGVHVVLHDLAIHRDIHYRADGRNATTTPWQLAPDEYFTLGDNSANSKDSREWEIPGVPGRDFLGKPFFIHQPLKVGRFGLNGRDRRLQVIDWDRLKLME
jgi:signal peptidase I